MKILIVLIMLGISSQKFYAQNERKIYDDNGNLYSIAISEDDSPSGIVDWLYYFENGNVRKKGRTINFKLVGNWKVYYENGQLKEDQYYDHNGNTTGTWKFYYKNGQLFMIGKSSNGQNIGEWEIYHMNGQLATKGVFLNGKPKGSWKVYDKNGNLIKTEVYE